MLRMTICRSRVFVAVLLMAAVVGPLSTASAQAAAKPQTYTVKRGDTLMSIARELYGDAARWQEIFKANSSHLSDPQRIYPGMVLTLPEAGGAVAAPAKPAQESKAEPSRQEPPRREIQTPQPQPERPAIVIQEPEQRPEPAPDSLFVRKRGVDAYTALRTYREQPYRPLRPGEFFSSGFLTEEQSLPFGRVLGNVTPEQIRNLTERGTVMLGTTIAIRPPEGAQYAVNDSLMLCETFQGPKGYGEIVYPTGMARVTGQNDGQAIAIVVSVYGAIRNGQFALPAEKFVPGGTSRAQPVENGVTGTVLGQRQTRELKHPQDFLFLSVGKTDGVAPGDIFEVRRDAHARTGAADTMDELMATLQVVHVREHSSTAKIINVVSPDIAPGTRVVQVAKLP
jgi:LysM domain